MPSATITPEPRPCCRSSGTGPGPKNGQSGNGTSGARLSLVECTLTTEGVTRSAISAIDALPDGVPKAGWGRGRTGAVGRTGVVEVCAVGACPGSPDGEAGGWAGRPQPASAS